MKAHPIIRRSKLTEDRFRVLPPIYTHEVDGVFFTDYPQAREYQDQLEAEEGKSEMYKSQLTIVH